MKKLLGVSFFVLLLAFVFQISSTDTFALTGSGTVDNPYIMEGTNDPVAFAKANDSTFRKYEYDCYTGVKGGSPQDPILAMNKNGDIYALWFLVYNRTDGAKGLHNSSTFSTDFTDKDSATWHGVGFGITANPLNLSLDENLA